MTTVDAVLAVAYAAFALVLAVPVGLAASFVSLGAPLGLTAIARRVLPIVGGEGRRR